MKGRFILTIILVAVGSAAMGGVKGRITDDGAVLLEYRSENRWADSIGAIVTYRGKVGIINSEGNFIVPPEYDKVWLNNNFKTPIFSEGTLPVMKNGKWGYVDTTGQVTVALQYSDTYPFKNGFAKVSIDSIDGRSYSGAINKKGKMVVPTRYCGVSYEPAPSHFSCEKWNEEYKHLLKEDGTLMFPFNTYSIHNRPSEGVVKFSKDGMGRNYFTDGEGNIIPGTYYNADIFSNGFAKVEIRDKEKGYIPVYMDHQGNYYLKGMYDWLATFDEDGFAMVRLNGKFGIINTSFTEVVPCIYDKLETPGHTFFENGLTEAKRDGKWGVINSRGEVIVDFEDDSRFHLYGDGYIRKRLDNKKQLMSPNGKPMTLMEYDYIGDFEQGYAAVVRNELYGVIDETGKEIIPCIYESTRSVSALARYGVLVVKKDGKWGIINKRNEIVAPIKYKNIEFFREGLAKFLDDHKFGFLDTYPNFNAKKIFLKKIKGFQGDIEIQSVDFQYGCL